MDEDAKPKVEKRMVPDVRLTEPALAGMDEAGVRRSTNLRVSRNALDEPDKSTEYGVPITYDW